jgi:hypothetical protein
VLACARCGIAECSKSIGSAGALLAVTPAGREWPWFALCSASPTDVREGTSSRCNAHFPKCRHRRHPVAWSGKFADSFLEGSGFEPSVPACARQERPRRLG